MARDERHCPRDRPTTYSAICGVCRVCTVIARSLASEAHIKSVETDGGLAPHPATTKQNMQFLQKAEPKAVKEIKSVGAINVI